MKTILACTPPRNRNLAWRSVGVMVGAACLTGAHADGPRQPGTSWVSPAPEALEVNASRFTEKSFDWFDSQRQRRVQDLRYSLDKVLAAQEGALFDTRRITATGHSYGANTAMLIVGAQVGQLVLAFLNEIPARNHQAMDAWSLRNANLVATFEKQVP